MGGADATCNLQGASNINTVTAFSVNMAELNQDINTPGGVATGLWAFSRTSASGAGAVKAYYRGPTTLANPVATDPSASAGPTLFNASLYIGARNIGSVSLATSRQYAAAWVGAGITGAEFTTISNRIEAFMDDAAIGAGVIP